MPSPPAWIICLILPDYPYQSVILPLSNRLSRSGTLTIGSLDRTGIPAAVVYTIGHADLSGGLSDGTEEI